MIIGYSKCCRRHLEWNNQCMEFDKEGHDIIISLLVPFPHKALRISSSLYAGRFGSWIGSDVLSRPVCAPASPAKAVPGTAMRCVPLASLSQADAKWLTGALNDGPVQCCRRHPAG